MTDLKRMGVHEALDKARAENERLEEEIRSKTDLYNNLRKAQIEMVTKFQETKLQSEKQAHELNAKSEEMINKLEEKHRDIEDQLKWKNEHFQHLEEAHERLQETFQSSKTEWEKEKSLLLDEICSIQKNLDSQTRISETLQTQLKICNQALAHEESTRKLLEVEVSEYKSRYDNVFLECNEAKETIEKLSHKRDEEVAVLRDTLATKDSLSKEMGYKMAHLEQENQDLTASLKEFQESLIVKCQPTGSLKKLQKRYQDLEQLHKKCKENLEEKETQMEKTRKEMDKHLSKLKFQNEQVKQLQEELEKSRIQNDKESSDDFSHKFVEMEKEKQFAESQSMLLETSLQACKIENQSLVCKANEQNEKIVDLHHQVVLLEQLVTERTETIEAQKQDKEKYLKIIQDKETSKENLLIDFEQEKESLLHVIEERNKRIEELIEEMTNAFKISEEKQIEKDVLHHALEKMKIEVSDLLEKMKMKDESLLHASQHAEELQALLGTKQLEKEIEIDVINQSLHKMEIEVSDLHEKMKVKDESLLQASQHAEELQALLGTKHLEKEIEIDVLHHALGKMEIEVSDLHEKVKMKDESLLQASQHAEELQVLLETKKLEKEIEIDVINQSLHKMEIEVSDLCEKMKLMDEEVEVLLKLEIEKVKKQLGDEKRQLEVKNHGLCEDIAKLLSDWEDLINQMGKMSEKMGGFCKDDEVLMSMLDNMLQKSTV